MSSTGNRVKLNLILRNVVDLDHVIKRKNIVKERTIIWIDQANLKGSTLMKELSSIYQIWDQILQRRKFLMNSRNMVRFSIVALKGRMVDQIFSDML